jgi:hypothetical protein
MFCVLFAKLFLRQRDKSVLLITFRKQNANKKMRKKQ